MRVIFKDYITSIEKAKEKFNVNNDYEDLVFEVDMGKEAEIINADVINGEIMLWSLYPKITQRVNRKFRIAVTGSDIPESEEIVHIKTIIQDGLIFHILEIINAHHSSYLEVNKTNMADQKLQQEVNKFKEEVSNIWNFVSSYYPNYTSSDEIAWEGDLYKLINNEHQDGDCSDEMLKESYNNDIKNPQIEIDRNKMLVSIYEKAIEGFLQNEGEKQNDIVYKIYGKGEVDAEIETDSIKDLIEHKINMGKSYYDKQCKIFKTTTITEEF